MQIKLIRSVGKVLKPADSVGLQFCCCEMCIVLCLRCALSSTWPLKHAGDGIKH